MLFQSKVIHLYNPYIKHCILHVSKKQCRIMDKSQAKLGYMLYFQVVVVLYEAFAFIDFFFFFITWWITLIAFHAHLICSKWGLIVVASSS